MKDKREKYKQLKIKILALAAPSSNPDNYIDLVDALNRVQENMEVVAERAERLQKKL